jgi:hypothetical protein
MKGSGGAKDNAWLLIKEEDESSDRDTDRVLFPEDGITKRDPVHYYASRIDLPLQDRSRSRPW